MQVSTRYSVLLSGVLMLFAPLTHADETIILTIKEHRFAPAELIVPAGKKLILVVDNQDSTPEEFESHSLNREKIIPGKSQIKLFIGPLKPGSYDFVGEFHHETAQGRLIAR